MIKHIVMWKFKDGEKENMKKFLEGLNSLKKRRAEIKDMENGINIKNKNDYDANLNEEYESREEGEKDKKNQEELKGSEVWKERRSDRKAIE